MTLSSELLPAVPSVRPVERSELASFLRTRRQRITPEQVGLSMTGRRRTPGLRREEVAFLAGIGVTWYTWLEQGRAINVSEPVLAAVARTLLLTSYERAHLYKLAGHPEPLMDREGAEITNAMRTILRHLEPIPAAVINARFDLLACNATYAQMVGGMDHLDPEDRNWLVLMLTSPTWRASILDWDDAVGRLIGRFRADMAAHADEAAWKNLVARLREASPDFRRLWELHEVRGPENLTKRYLHADVGLMTFDYMQMSIGGTSALRLATYTPTDDDTWAKVGVLHEAAGRTSDRKRLA